MTRTNVVSCGVMAFLMIVMVAPAFAQSGPVRVYVFTAESRFVNDESTGRSDSVKDIIKALRTKDREIVVVDNRADAELTLEVLGRGLVPGGHRVSFDEYVSGRYRSSPEPKATVWVTLATGDFSTETVADCGTVIFAVWSEAARNLATEVVRWIIENQRAIGPIRNNETAQQSQTPLPAPRDIEIFSSGNTAAVASRPTAPARFTLSRPHVITMISTYHWNDGRGTGTGTVGLIDAIGQMFGPWTVTGTPGQGGVPNANWTCAPNVEIPAGTYTIVDSEPATWSQNADSGGRGMALVKGYPIDLARLVASLSGLQ